MTTGQKISELRKAKDITQDDLAERLGVSRQSVSRWESDAAFPETDTLIRLCDYLGCTVDYLLRNEKGAPANAAKPAAKGTDKPRSITGMAVMLGVVFVVALVFLLVTTLYSVNYMDCSIEGGTGLPTKTVYSEVTYRMMDDIVRNMLVSYIFTWVFFAGFAFFGIWYVASPANRRALWKFIPAVVLGALFLLSVAFVLGMEFWSLQTIVNKARGNPWCSVG